MATTAGAYSSGWTVTGSTPSASFSVADTHEKRSTLGQLLRAILPDESVESPPPFLAGADLGDRAYLLGVFGTTCDPPIVDLGAYERQ